MLPNINIYSGNSVLKTTINHHKTKKDENQNDK